MQQTLGGKKWIEIREKEDKPGGVRARGKNTT